ncbi:redox-regulated ATPase YchF [Candidatus Uhrbacteria bacterium]|nr:redox-regulated ATPase YchF [Candidatus Uhrbacteria bacterium]
MNIGIVGLPNVGKSTLFTALTKKRVDIANYPFCTIQPNTGIVKVPDERLSQLAHVSKSAQIIPASIEFVDIAGLVRGAHTGEGLGNTFLAHIREVDMIAHVVRVFQDSDIVHVAQMPDPREDIETIHFELICADLATVEKRLGTVRFGLRSMRTRELEQAGEILERIYVCLQNGRLASEVAVSEEEETHLRDLHLLTRKKMMYVLNTSENGDIPEIYKEAIESYIKGKSAIALCAKSEAELADLTDDEIAELGLKRTGLDKLIIEAYKELGLITFFTSGPKETRAWTIRNRAKAPEAAGVIHTDFEKGFIRAEIIHWEDLVDLGGEIRVKERGLMRLEGREYIMKDGDVAVFRFAT